MHTIHRILRNICLIHSNVNIVEGECQMDFLKDTMMNSRSILHIHTVQVHA